MTTLLNAPAGVTEINDSGIKYRPAADGTISVPDNRVPTFLKMGCTQHAVSLPLTTVRRPTTTTPGETMFDTTLGKPIWRNAANTQWVDATGATV